METLMRQSGIGNKRRGMVMRDRDLRVLREIAEMRVVDREQAKTVAHFGSTTRVNDRLLRLTRAELLRRFFLGTKAGPTKALYSISAKGAEYVGVPLRGPRRRRNEVLVGEAAVEHQLTVNSVYCALKYRVPSGSDQHLVIWHSFYEPIAPGTNLIPDGYAEVGTAEKRLSMFFEIDLGTEALRVWSAKINAYLFYAASGEFERRFQQQRFRVLVIASSEGRMHSLRKLTSSVTEKVFWFATLESVNQSGFW